SPPSEADDARPEAPLPERPTPRGGLTAPAPWLRLVGDTSRPCPTPGHVRSDTRRARPHRRCAPNRAPRGRRPPPCGTFVAAALPRPRTGRPGSPRAGSCIEAPAHEPPGRRNRGRGDSADSLRPPRRAARGRGTPTTRRIGARLLPPPEASA